MIVPILIKRGLAADRPALLVGELGLDTDTGILWVGTPSGNVPSSNNFIVQLTDASTITVPVTQFVTIAKVTLSGNRVLGNPSGAPSDGWLLEIRVKQDAGGSRTLSYDTKYRFGTDITSITLTTTASKRDYILFQYCASDDKWDCIALSQGY